MNTTVKTFKNKSLSVVSTALMGCLALVGLQGCGSSSGSAPEAFIIAASQTSGGAEADGFAEKSSISGDGRYVIFASDAANLVSGINANLAPGSRIVHIYLHDLQTNAYTLASQSTEGVEADANSGGSSISADGRYVLFSSSATNLLANAIDGNAVSDVFRYDRVTGTTERVSVTTGVDDGIDASEGAQGAGGGGISGDGRYVVFSTVNSLVVSDTNGATDVYLRDMLNKTTTLISLASDGSLANSDSFNPKISSNGLVVAFVSEASNLVTDISDVNAANDIYVRDLTANTTIRVSSPTGVIGINGVIEPAEDSEFPSISADGRYVTFTNRLTTLDEFDNGNNDCESVFLRDIQTNTTTLISKPLATLQRIDCSGGANDSSISADGRYVTFGSGFDNLVLNDTNVTSDIFLYDTTTDETTRISVSSMGVEGNSFSSEPKISADGRYVVFGSDATNLLDNSGDDTLESSFRVLISALPK